MISGGPGGGTGGFGRGLNFGSGSGGGMGCFNGSHGSRVRQCLGEQSVIFGEC